METNKDIQELTDGPIEAIMRDIAELEYTGLEDDTMEVTPEDLQLILERHIAASQQGSGRAQPTTAEINLALALGTAHGTLRALATVSKDPFVVKKAWAAVQEIDEIFRKENYEQI